MKMAPAATAPRFRMYRYQASRHRLACATGAPADGSSTLGSAGTEAGSAASRRSIATRASPGLSRSRVQDAVHDVYEEVRDHDDHRGQHGYPHHNRIVTVRDGVDEVAADARDREDELDHERAGDDQTEERRRRRHGRNERVAEHVEEDDAAVAEALGFGRAHVILLHRLEHRATDEPREVGHREEPERE